MQNAFQQLQCFYGRTLNLLEIANRRYYTESSKIYLDCAPERGFRGNGRFESKGKIGEGKEKWKVGKLTDGGRLESERRGKSIGRIERLRAAINIERRCALTPILQSPIYRPTPFTWMTLDQLISQSVDEVGNAIFMPRYRR
jgi:hypothetical protein